ncbi:MAG: hydroxymethylglutaryl-CoA synthase family protein [Desulfobacteraceae bacterium]|nr:hydroxymethylglutaryl-CoA synthase family protein [Desulfobacteraceae bacterium]
MIPVGIEALNIYGGAAFINVRKLAGHRQLDVERFENLLMDEKTVALPCEDPVSFAVNAAKPIIDNLSQEEKDRIELLITCSESGIDFGKSMSTYVHDCLGLNRNCRLFEIKQACYAGTAGLQMSATFILSQLSPGAKALVIASDISRFILEKGKTAQGQDWSYAEPSSGAGAAAMLVGENPIVFQLDAGASGYYGYEVMDTCRPIPDGDCGDADLSLMSYLDCCEQSFREYKSRVDYVDYKNSFQFLIFHTPFGGMVKGAHRNMMRKMAKAAPGEIGADFEKRVVPGLNYCRRVGNIMGGTIFMALASTIDQGNMDGARRIGCFSYGSGCCSEFYSGVVSDQSQALQGQYEIQARLDNRYELSMEEYDALLHHSSAVKFGTRNVKIDDRSVSGVTHAWKGIPLLFLKEIKEFHRQYEWVS